MVNLLTPGEGTAAVKLARSAVERYVKTRETVEVPPNLPEVFNEKRGVFVTLNKRGDLRGCIGYPYPMAPLVDAIVDSAISAAARDPRFPPVAEAELEELRVEVTVLTPPEKINAKPKDLPDKIVIGKHGLIVKRGIHQGLLLPQVAPEHGMDKEDFLSHTCMKAGLYPDDWLDDGTEVYSFEGQIFGEIEDGVEEKKFYS